MRIMKFNKITRLTIVAMSFLMLFGCKEDLERADYITFSGTKYEISIQQPETSGSVQVVVYSTRVTGSDRTFTINVDPSSTADPAFYTVPSSVTIPANSNEGIINIETTDANLGTSIVLNFENVEGLYEGGQTIVNIPCPFNIQSFVGTFAANEEGYCDGCYDVTVTYDAENNILVFYNLYETGGYTAATFDETGKVNFRSREFDMVLQMSSQYGKVWAINPIDSSITSTFDFCGDYIDLYFQRQVSAGTFSAVVHIQLTKI